ncbi:MAG: hypothetical protein LV473_12580 [Nitrospira sp.]|nr:hypothetical protein [Nitrospira sp.]
MISRVLVYMSAAGVLMLSGCAIAAKVRARDDMEASKAVYKRCLQEHPDDPLKCEALRQAYEADLKAFRATSHALTGSASVTIEK